MINFGFFIKKVFTRIYTKYCINSRPVCVLKTGNFFVRKIKSRAAQVTLEYFILFTVFTTICLISAGAIFNRARRNAEIYYEEQVDDMYGVR